MASVIKKADVYFSVDNKEMRITVNITEIKSATQILLSICDAIEYLFLERSIKGEIKLESIYFREEKINE